MEGSFTEETFDTLALKPELLRALSERGFEKMTPVQAQAIPLMLEGQDLIAQAQTGTGKTAAFGLPVLERIDPENPEPQALILCPTRELAVQSATEIRSCAAYLQGVKTLPVYGGQEITRQISGLRGTQIVVGTPGRIMDHMRRHTLKLDEIRTVILDEADEMLDMGFLEDMEEILGQIPEPHQTAMFSATMPEEITALSGRFLKDPVSVKITGEELTVPDIEQFWYRVRREEKVQALVRLISCYGYRKCMIFCNTKSAVDDLVSELQKNGCMAEALHGDLSQFLRDAAMKRFRENERCVLAATDIAARGIDVGDVEAVFNYDIPMEAEYYVHRIGRTGRAGKTGASHTLATSREYYKLRFIEALCHSKMTERQIPTACEIHEAKKERALEEALEKVRDIGCTELLTGIHSFCNEHAVTPEELAAAFLFLKTGRQPEPEKEPEPENRRGKRGRHFPQDGSSFSGRRHTGSAGPDRALREHRPSDPEKQSRRAASGPFPEAEWTPSVKPERQGRNTAAGDFPGAEWTPAPKPERQSRNADAGPFPEKDRTPAPAAKPERQRRKETERRNRNRDREENYRWGKFDFIERDFRAEQKGAAEGRDRQSGSGKKPYVKEHGSFRGEHQTKTESFRHGNGSADPSFPDRSERKANRERSGRILAQAVKDVNSAGWAAPRKKRKTPAGKKH